MPDSRSRSAFVVLYVEDDEQSIAQMRRGFADCRLDAELIALRPAQCLSYLRREGEYHQAAAPDLLLLDLDSSEIDGLSLLRQIRADARFCLLPVIALTDRDDDDQVLECYRLRANSFLKKPRDDAALIDLVRGFGGYWLQVATLPSGKTGERPGARH